MIGRENSVVAKNATVQNHEFEYPDDKMIILQ